MTSILNVTCYCRDSGLVNGKIMWRFLKGHAITAHLCFLLIDFNMMRELLTLEDPSNVLVVW